MPWRVTTFLPRRARAGDHDAQRVGGGRDLGSEVPALSTEVEGERGGGGAAAHDRGDILGRRVVAKREGVAADAGARGFAHVQRRGDRDGGVKGVASRSQDAEARLEARVCEDATMPRVAIVGPRRPLNSIAVALSPHDFDPCPAMTASRCPSHRLRFFITSGENLMLDRTACPVTIPRDLGREEQALQTIMAAMTGGPIEVSAGLKRAISVDVTNKDDMLEIMPLGAGSEVGRSCVLASHKNKTVMFDRGVHPGYAGIASLPLPYFDEVDLSTVDAMLITHFHLDHCAAVPFVVGRTNFKGRILMTHPTKAIFAMLMNDFVKLKQGDNSEAPSARRTCRSACGASRSSTFTRRWTSTA